MTTATAPSSTPFDRMLALATAEIRLLLRNRTSAVSAFVIPLGIGVLWAFLSDGMPGSYTLAIQLAFIIGMGVYATITQNLVARRHAGVLKRLRTTSLGDNGLFGAIVAPPVLFAVGQFVVLGIVDVVVGVALPADPIPVVLAALGGLALGVTAGIATAAITPSPERAQITTLPLIFLVLGAAVFAALAPLTEWWQALVVLPGGAIGALVQVGVTGAGWGAALLPLVALIAWPIVFGLIARRTFRWEPRR